MALLVAGAACSGGNKGYSARTAPPAAAATPPAAVQQAASPASAPAVAATPFAAGSSTQAASPSAGAATAPALAATPAAPLPVGIAGFAFTPATLHVPVGGSVVWTNNDAVTHTVTPDAGGIDAHELAPGAGFTQTFNTAGTFSYHCAIHPFMKGSIVVG
ncbi:MAG TPA: cupredoxin family copper-binding protein [Dehalococcoidia bacterium]|nr:cupredoxin family copper-binding protein [Dehalococcoidia bacterium]